MKKIILFLLIATTVKSQITQTNLRCDAFEVKFKSMVDCSNLITTHQDEELKICNKTGPLILDGYVLRKVVYIFRKNQLNCIIVMVDGDENCEGILKVLKDIYGRPFEGSNSGPSIWENEYISCWYHKAKEPQKNKSIEIVLAFKK
jgi:hypothetical protein